MIINDNLQSVPCCRNVASVGLCNMNLRSEKRAHKSKLRQWQLAVSKTIIIRNYRCMVALILFFPDSPQKPKSLNYVGLISKICYVSHSSLFVVKLIEGRKKISMPHLKSNFKLSPVKPFRERIKMCWKFLFRHHEAGNWLCFVFFMLSCNVGNIRKFRCSIWNE